MASTPEIYSLPESQTQDLSRCTDQMLISILREQDINALSGEVDQMDSWCLLRQNVCSQVVEALKTVLGTWLPKKMVSIRNTSQGNSPNSPKFVGTKTTMEFKHTDGSKAVVGMTRYNLLTTREDGDGLNLDEDLALCHVFPLEGKAKGTRNRNGKRSRSGHEVDPHEPITHAGVEELDQMMSDSKKYPVLDVGMDVQDLLFADQPSKHWQSFTKIHTKNPKLMYAACNHCDTMLKLTGGTKCGTGSLKHHSDSCRCKPKQESLPDNSSSMPIQSIALQAITG
ncbi:uncharacterized protein LOC119274399 [Triticum dicoccoides]|uniref:uncharacterized protein LOC119274399 n=1 Tax=Triticum dicoccoides TaxID=85692 RepID=UPI000E7C7379|nr:uncharacterized protein LOC119274399 [Triticum dicoccoides]